MIWARNNAEVSAFDAGYRVSECGNLINPNGKRILGSRTRNGYVRFCARGKHTFAHRLVAYQKYGINALDPTLCVRHIDGDPSNNSHSNITIGTQSDNMMDQMECVRIQKAIKASRAAQKYNHSEVIRLYSEGFTYQQIMAAMGIPSLGTISFIIRKSITAKVA